MQVSRSGSAAPSDVDKMVEQQKKQLQEQIEQKKVSIKSSLIFSFSLDTASVSVYGGLYILIYIPTLRVCVYIHVYM